MPESLCVEEAKEKITCCHWSIGGRKMGKCEGVFESTGSHWAGKSPQCQVRTLDWGLVRWDPLTFRKEGGMSGLDLETASPPVM